MAVIILPSMSVKREFSAGGVIFKKTREGVLWLVRRPTPSEGYRGNLGWSWPKGWIDDADEGKNPGPKASGQEKATLQDLQTAALREVREEAGVKAKIINKISTIKVFFTDNSGERVMKFITYFLMEFESELPEGFGFETEEVKWVSTDEAAEMLAYKSEKELLSVAKERGR